MILIENAANALILITLAATVFIGCRLPYIIQQDRLNSLGE